MRKYFFLPIFYITCSLSIFLHFGCTKKDTENTIKIAATPVPQAQMLEDIRDELKQKGYDLHIVETQDYNVPNRALAEKEIDANFFQHIPFMEEQIKQFGYPIECYVKTHIEPMGIYSQKYSSLDALPDKAQIAIPNDPTNEYRALKLLEDARLITIRNTKLGQATIKDIISNPKQLKILEIDAAMIPRSLFDVDAAAINANFALQAGLQPQKDALILEKSDSPYVNIIAIRKGDENKPKLKALKEAMLSEKMRSFILTKYQGSLIPVLKSCPKTSSSLD